MCMVIHAPASYKAPSQAKQKAPSTSEGVLDLLGQMLNQPEEGQDCDGQHT